MTAKQSNQRGQTLRIVSLIPSATEIVAALGYGDRLVGRSHECDYPAFVKDLPICTEPKFDPVGSSAQIHQRVTDLLASALSVYRVKTEVLAALKPTHIITQAQCEVCAVSLSDVENAVAELMFETAAVHVVSLQPERLDDVWADMARVAAALGKTEREAQTAIASYKDRIAQPRMAQPDGKSNGSKATRPKVACLEWTDPLMAAGNWVPELVELAGGVDCLGKAGRHSEWLSWEAIAAADPDLIVVLPCGYDLIQTRQATQEMAKCSQWHELRAVKSGDVYLTDGNQYFNRPGPRLVDSCDILTEIIQGRQPSSARASVGWERWQG